jgi:microcystin-dependent protein
MTIQIKHAFTSAKGDGTDATLVRPSNWNAAHTTSMATANLLGRLTAGAGSFEELPTSAYIIAALAAIDASSFLAALGIGGFETGDVKFTINNQTSAGWIIYSSGAGSGTIGDASSAATIRANADCSALFQLIWNSIADADCPVPGGRGGSASIDWNNHKQIYLPWIPGRAIIGAAGGAPLTSRTHGRVYGEENHLLTTAEMPSHTHPNSLSDPGHYHTYNQPTGFGNSGGGVGLQAQATPSNTGVNVTGMAIINAAQGGGGSHNVMQPSIALFAKVKL